MSSAAITAELREYAQQAVMRDDYMAGLSYDLDRVADHIDAEHERRMDDCRREVRREVIRYMRGVLTDLDRGVRRVRKGDKAEVVRCRDCVHSRPAEEDAIYYCDKGTFGLMGGTAYCSLGKRREVSE